jgi:cytochrome P450
MLEPSIREREQHTGAKPKSDMVQWIMENSSPNDKSNATYITSTQMLISVVAIHTTAMTMTQIIFDLLAHPEYIDILREEIRAVKPTEDEPWTKQKIAALAKMDSFMKESQRFRPPGLVTMNRQVEKDVQLSNGTVLKKGSHIAVAAGPNALDPQLCDNPHEFDGLRFFRLRQLPGTEHKYQVSALILNHYLTRG